MYCCIYTDVLLDMLEDLSYVMSSIPVVLKKKKKKIDTVINGN